jgi:hypothetical protein
LSHIKLCPAPNQLEGNPPVLGTYSKYWSALNTMSLTALQNNVYPSSSIVSVDGTVYKDGWPSITINDWKGNEHIMGLLVNKLPVLVYNRGTTAPTDAFGQGQGLVLF